MYMEKVNCFRIFLFTFLVIFWVVGFWFVDIYGVQPVLTRVVFIILTFTFIFFKKNKLIEIWIILYSITLTAIILIISATSVRPDYSGLRALIACLLFGVAGVVVSSFIGVVERHVDKLLPPLNAAFSLFLVVLLVGYVLGWEGYGWAGMGGYRLAGGINPNTAGFLGFVLVVWSLISVFAKGVWHNYDKILITLALAVMVLSFSRSSWLSLAVLFSFVMFARLLRIVVQLKIRLSDILIFSVLFSACVFLILFLFVDLPIVEAIRRNFPMARFLERRLTVDGDSNLWARIQAWRVLLDLFRSNPLFGGVGWYNSAILLEGPAGSAHSSHNLHIRLLAEVGVVGYISVMSLPIFAITIAIMRMVNLLNYRDCREKYEFWSVVSGSLFAYFVAYQSFEDGYMISFMNFSTTFALMLIILAVRGFSPTRTLARRMY